MDNRMKFLKRLMAFLLALLLVTSMMGDDFFSLADEDAVVESVVEQPAESSAPVESAPVESANVSTDMPAPAESSNDVQSEAQDTTGELENYNAENPENLENNLYDIIDETNPATSEEEANSDVNEPQTTDDNIDSKDNETIIDGEATDKDKDVTDEELTDEEKDEEDLEEEKLDTEDDEDKEDEECEHIWEYISNGDGTHIIRCKECGEESTESCDYDETGVCIHCGHELEIEDEEECEHEWEYTPNGDGTHTKKCVLCGEEIIEDCEYDEDGVCIHCGYEDMSLEWQTFSKTIHGVKVTVSGEMPRKSDVTIYYRRGQTIENIINDNLDEGTVKVFAAYDINIYDRKGNEYQPKWDDNTVKVTFENVEELEEADEEIVVYRVEDDNSVTAIESSVSGDDVTFEAEHFTVYAVTSHSSNDYVEFWSYEGFGTYMTPTEPYTSVLYATFDLYVDDTDEEYNFSAHVYRNPTSYNLTSGTEIASGSIDTFSPTKTGWYTVQIPVTELIDKDGYIAKGQTYSIVVNCDTTVKVGYDLYSGLSCPTYKKNSDGVTWSATSFNKVLYLSTSACSETGAAATLKEYTSIDEDVSVTGIELSKAINTNNKYIFAKGETDTLTAVLSSSGIERSISWTSGDPNIATVTSGEMTSTFTAVGTGETTIIASYNGKNYSITVVVIDLLIGGISATDSTGDSPVTSSDSVFDYTGDEVKPAVTITNGNSDTISVSSTTYSSCVNAGTAKVVITVTSGGTRYQFDRYYKINSLNISKTVTVSGESRSAFTNAIFVIQNQAVSSVTNVNVSPNNPLGVTPVFGTDFTVSVGTATIESTGVTYPLTITGVGNFTGTLSMNYTPSNTDIADIVDAVITLNPTYNGIAITDDEIWANVKFYDKNGNELSGLITSTNAEISVSDESASEDNERTDAGIKTVTFTPTGTGYTGSVKGTFTINQAELSDTTIIFNNGTGEFEHTGNEVKPYPSDDEKLGYKVYLGYVDSTNTGVQINTDDFSYTWVGDCTKTSDTPKVKITSTGKNFETGTTQEKSYSIIASFDLDIVVRITNGTTHDGTKNNNYVTGYERYYDGTDALPSISVRLGGNPLATEYYSYQVYDSYDSDTKAYTTRTKNVGTKYIVVTGLDKYDGKEVVATYNVTARPLTTSEVTVVFESDSSKTKVDDKVFTGTSQELSTASLGDSDGKDIAVKYGSTYLVEGTDYEIEYPSDITNVGTIEYSINGLNNFTGTLSGTKYQYDITKATIGTDANANFADTSVTYTYDGNAKRPSVKVTIGDEESGYTFEETFKYDESKPTVLETENFIVTYTNNISPTTTDSKAVITITGQNNLEGDATLKFDIISNKTAYSAIYLGGTNLATLIKEDGDTRYYKCETLVTTYTGSKYRGTPTIYHASSTAPLTNGVDYAYQIVNGVNANTDTTYSLDSSPYVYIKGLGKYAGNDAYVYFNIQLANLEDATFGDFDTSYPWDGTDAVEPIVDITYNNKALTNISTDEEKLYGYTVEYYDNYDETSGTGTTITKAAGTKYAVFTGVNNFTGTVVKTYNVGNVLDSAKVVIKSGYYNETTNNEIFIPSDTNDGTISDTPFDITWRYGKAPIITLVDANDNPIDSGAYTISTPISSQGFTDDNLYNSRAAGGTGDYNILTYTVTPNTDNGYYGDSITFKVQISPQVITTNTDSGQSKRMRVGKDSSKSQSYTGKELSFDPVFIFTYGSTTALDVAGDDISCELTGGDDFTPSPISVGTNADDELKVTVTGVGNYTGTQELSYEISPANVDIYLSKDGTETLLGSTSDSTAMSITDAVATYTYSGDNIDPTLVIKVAGTSNNLTLDTDYTIEYENDINPSTTGNLATATITITNTNIIESVRTITVSYEIKTNTIANYTGVLSDISYTAIAGGYTPEVIKEYVEDANNTTTLTIKSDSGELVYGEDYEIVTSDELDSIKAQSGYESVSSVQGQNTIPSYGNNTNYIFVKGKEGSVYSGYLMVPFNIVLDISSTAYASVSVAQASYELDDNGAPTVPIAPIIKYREIGGAQGTYTETLDNSFTLNNDTTVYNYNVSRDRDGLPGPDETIAFVGQYACTGTASNMRYDDSTSSGSVVYFLADLSKYTTSDISMSGGTVYAYTGSAITVEFTGDVLDGATQVSGRELEGDYTVIYAQNIDDIDLNETQEAIGQGKWYAVICANDNSRYFKKTTKTGTTFSFNIKYDLSKCTMTFANDAGVTIESTPYTGSAFVFAQHTNIVAADGTSVFDQSGTGADYITFTPVSQTQICTDKTITASAIGGSNEYCYGDCKTTFSVSGIDISDCTINLSGTEFDYTGFAIEPTVSVVHPTNGTLRKDTDYTVKYSDDHTNAGSCTVTITGIGAYSNAIQKSYTINPVTLTKDMITVATASYAGKGVSVEPSITVKLGSYTLVEDSDYTTPTYANNTYVRDDAAVTISAGTSGNFTGTVTQTFTINKLDLRTADITIDPDSVEWTGATINPYDKVSVKLGDVTLISAQNDSSAYDYQILVYNNGTKSELKNQGTYELRIDAGDSVNCENYKEITFTVTTRALPNDFHYYYSASANAFLGSTMSYDSTNKRYVYMPKEDGVVSDDDTLTVYIYDVETVGTDNTPTVSIVDSGVQVGSSAYELKNGTDYTVSVENATSSGTAEWSKTLTADDYHALPTASAPAVTITGIGNYTGSITLPYNIGKNINTLTDLSVTFTMTNADVSSFVYGSESEGSDGAGWHFNAYNGVAQKPSITVYGNGKTLRERTAYTVSYTDVYGDTDSSIDAGYKYVVITGIGDYCGTITQKYAINRKEITANGGPFYKDDMLTDGKELTFNLSNGVKAFTSSTLNTYLVDTGLMTEDEAAAYEGYYYAVYDGSAIEPTVTVKDNTLGRNGTTSATIDSDKELKFTYNNENAVSTVENGKFVTFSSVTVSFANNSSGNYYEPTAAISYQINYLIVSHDISDDFDVRFINETDGNKYDYDEGKAIEPEIEVTNGSRTLIEGDDYEISYGTKTVSTFINNAQTDVTISDNIVPGEATITITGIGNYRGTKTLSFYIWGDLADTDTFYIDDNDNFVEGYGEIPIQQYTGTYITTGEPRVYLALPKQNDQEYDVVLTYSTDYYVTNYSSDNSYVVDATIEYAGTKSTYWSGSKIIDYDIEYDSSTIKATNYETSYLYTGYDIEPDFKLNVSSADIGTVTYTRDGSRTSDLTSLGTVKATIPYTIGSYSGSVTASYEIIHRPISECTVETTKTYTRYTGRAAKPAFTVFIESTNIKTEASQIKTLTLDEDYTVDYGNYVYGDAKFTLSGISDEIYSSTEVSYIIKLQSVANLRVTENTGDSLTAEWVRDMYSTGTELTLQKMDSDGEYVDYITTRVVGKTNTYTFNDLASSTEYKIVATAYANVGDTDIYSDPEDVEAITEIATSDIVVESTSTGKVTVSWPTDGDVKLYYIYRATDESSTGSVIAIIPASTGRYTNSKLTSGSTYYYHIDGYALVDGVLTKVNTSEHIAVTVD